MGFQKREDGYYHVPIVDLGTRLRDNFGLTIREHSHFDPVDPVHSTNSYHYHDEAIDVQDWRDDVIDGVSWKDRTRNLKNLLHGSGAEVLGPGDKDHDTHLHLAADDGIFKLTQQQYDTLFGGDAGGELATFSSFSSPVPMSSAPVDGTGVGPSDGPIRAHVTAKERANSYAEMTKAQLDTEYDRLRAEDLTKAGIEGMKMHKAFFNK